MSRLDALDTELGVPSTGGQTALQAGGLTIDLRTEVVTVNGAPLSLSAREAGVLEALLLCRNECLNRDHLLRHLYDGRSHEIDARIVDVFVCMLGRKLRDAGLPNLIEVVPGQGYRIAGAD